MSCRWIGGLVLVAGMVFAGVASAASKIDGKWRWETESFRQGGEKQKHRVALKEEADGKLSGSYRGRDNQETPIKNGKIDKEGNLSFTVTRSFNNREIESKYVGKMEGDKIKGKFEVAFGGGEPRSIDWEAKRDVIINVTGTWKWARTRDDGTTVESILKLKQDGEKVSGVSIWNDEEEVKLGEGTVKDDVIAFQVVRERDGQKIVSKFDGKVEGDMLKGEAKVNVAGEDRTFDLEYKKQKE